MAITLLLHLFVGCGGSDKINVNTSNTPSYSGKTTPMAVTSASVNEILAEINDSVPLCSVVSTHGSLPSKEGGATNLLKILNIPVAIVTGDEYSGTPAVTGQRILPGDCGGRITYHDLYFFTDGSRGTATLNNLCTVVDMETRVLISGEIRFSRSGVGSLPASWGDALTVDSPLLVMTKTSTESSIHTVSTIGFDGLIYERSVFPSSSTRGYGESYRLKTLYSNTSDRQTMLSNVLILKDTAADGSTREAISGRIYIDTLGYLDGATVSSDPIAVSPNGTHLSGRVLLYGADEGSVSLTVVPATAPTFSIEKNGVPLSGIFLFCSKLYFNEGSSH